MKLNVMNAYIGSETDLHKPGYIFEPKLDGIRALCYVNHGLKFISRNQKTMTDKFQEFQFRDNIHATSAILDGEIVVYDEQGNPNFSLLQQGYQATYVVFDILMKNEKLLTHKPLIERKKILSQTVVDGKRIETIFFTNDGQALWKEITKRGLEGVVAKINNGLYYPGIRTRQWLKIKTIHTLDCVIVGFCTGKRLIASLMLGLYDKNGALTYIGNVGTGYKEAFIHGLYTLLNQQATDKLSIASKENTPKNCTWIKPMYVCEIKYSEFSVHTMVRHAVFLRLRDDKKPHACTFAGQ